MYEEDEEKEAYEYEQWFDHRLENAKPNIKTRLEGELEWNVRTQEYETKKIGLYLYNPKTHKYELLTSIEEGLKETDRGTNDNV